MFLEIIILIMGLIFFGFIGAIPTGQMTGTAPEEMECLDE